MKEKKTNKKTVSQQQGPRTGAQCVVDSLAKAGCEVLFGYPGGQAIDMFNCIYDAPFQFVLARHEQGAVHMADGYARATGKPGCCIVTSGPGATNTITGLATANMDGIPLVCITGQVPLHLIGTDAFQEADVMGITRSVSKHNFLVRDVDELPDIIAKAFYIATTGKPGPVVVDIPKNVQKAKTMVPSKDPAEVTMRAYRPNVVVAESDIKKLADLINRAERPLLYVGGGAISGNATAELFELAHKAQIPVCTTMMALGAFPENDPLSLGMVGMHGCAAANYAVDRSDLLISAGARFDDRVTGKIDEFAKRAVTVHIDIDRSAIGKNVETHFGLHGYLKQVLEGVLPRVKKTTRDAWFKQVKEWQTNYPLCYPQPKDVLMPQAVIKKIDELSHGKALITTDVGQNQMWATQFFTYTTPRSFISSGGLGTMGFGLPAAIGVQLGRPKELVVCVTGDGGIQMNIQELVVAVEHKLPIVIVILNNGVLGMVRQWQELFFDKRYSGVILGQHNRRPNEKIEDRDVYLPDFVKIAEAYGAQAMRVTTEDAVDAALQEAFASKKTTVIECIVSPEANVFPMIPPGMHVSAMVGHTKN